MKSMEHHGIWWSPAAPDREVSGILRFHPASGIELELFGGLDAPIEKTLLGDDDQPILCGVIQGGKYVTLRDCYSTSSRISFPGPTVQKLRVRYALLGSPLDSITDHRFGKAVLEFSALPEWVSTTGFNATYHVPDGEFQGMDVTYRFPEGLTARIPNGTVALTFGFQTEGDLIRGITLRQSQGFSVELDINLTVEEWVTRFVSPLNDLLTLLTGSPSTVTSVRLYSSEIVQQISETQTREVPIDLLYHPISAQPEDQKPLTRDRILVTLSEVRDHFADVIPKWLEIAEDLRIPFNLYFGVQYRPDVYIEQRFMAMAQAVETYHRLRRSNEVMLASEHLARLENILGRFDDSEELQQWMKQRLKYSNEPHLKSRVLELAKEAGPVIDRLIRTPNQFARKVADTRNYYTHFDEHLRSRASKGAELYYLTRTLSYMLMTCFLGELGITADECAELFGDYNEYSWAIYDTENLNKH